MKGRGCCWKLRGARVMLALCQHKEILKHLVFQYLPLETPEKPNRRKGLALNRLDRSEYLQAHMVIFDGPDQDKTLGRRVVSLCSWALNSLFLHFYGNS
jgi:hypothetical protein